MPTWGSLTGNSAGYPRRASSFSIGSPQALPDRSRPSKQQSSFFGIRPIGVSLASTLPSTRSHIHFRTRAIPFLPYVAKHHGYRENSDAYPEDCSRKSRVNSVFPFERRRERAPGINPSQAGLHSNRCSKCEPAFHQTTSHNWDETSHLEASSRSMKTRSPLGSSSRCFSPCPVNTYNPVPPSRLPNSTSCG